METLLEFQQIQTFPRVELVLTNDLSVVTLSDHQPSLLKLSCDQEARTKLKPCRD